MVLGYGLIRSENVKFHAFWKLRRFGCRPKLPGVTLCSVTLVVCSLDATWAMGGGMPTSGGKVPTFSDIFFP